MSTESSKVSHQAALLKAIRLAKERVTPTTGKIVVDAINAGALEDHTECVYVISHLLEMLCGKKEL